MIIADWIVARTMKRPPDFIIGAIKEDAYMLRWWVIPRNRFFNLYLHKVLRDDEDRALHDHPWASLSYMVSGGIWEVTNDGREWVKPGRWKYRGASYAHRLVRSAEPAVTLFFTGPRIRQWGFHCPKGWRHWKDFVAKDDAGSIGRGCGEMDQ
jgi:hypothetical protein